MLEASRRLAQLIPYDPAILARLAQSENQARNFTAAAHDYQLAHDAAPADIDLLNSLGYAQALAGNLDAARKSFEEYGRGAGEAGVNSLDSLGEALFLNGKFEEAEQQFLNAYKKDPNFLQGLTLWKAAHARWLAAPQDPANLAAADKIAERYFVARAEAQDPFMPLANAAWLYETGRTQEAEDFLMHQLLTQQAVPATVAAARQQLALWNRPDALVSDLSKLQQAYQRSDPVNDGLPRTLYAEALFHAGRKDEARDEMVSAARSERPDLSSDDAGVSFCDHRWRGFSEIGIEKFYSQIFSDYVPYFTKRRIRNIQISREWRAK